MPSLDRVNFHKYMSEVLKDIDIDHDKIVEKFEPILVQLHEEAGLEYPGFYELIGRSIPRAYAESTVEKSTIEKTTIEKKTIQISEKEEKEITQIVVPRATDLPRRPGRPSILENHIILSLQDGEKNYAELCGSVISSGYNPKIPKNQESNRSRILGRKISQKVEKMLECGKLIKTPNNKLSLPENNHDDFN